VKTTKSIKKRMKKITEILLVRAGKYIGRRMCRFAGSHLQKKKRPSGEKITNKNNDGVSGFRRTSNGKPRAK
jgi:hypothetical protein